MACIIFVVSCMDTTDVLFDIYYKLCCIYKLKITLVKDLSDVISNPKRWDPHGFSTASLFYFGGKISIIITFQRIIYVQYKRMKVKNWYPDITFRMR